MAGLAAMFSANSAEIERGLYTDQTGKLETPPRMSETDLRNLTLLKSAGFLDEVEATYLYSGQSTYYVDPNAQPPIINQNTRLLFAKVPGVFLEQEEAQGIRFSHSRRGLPPNFSRFSKNMIDGFPLNADFAGARTNYYIPEFFGVAQVQLAQNASVISGSSFGGLVNFVSYQPAGDQALRVKNYFTMGQDDYFADFLTASGTVDDVGYLVYGQYATGAGYQENTDFVRQGGGFKVKVPIDESSSLTLGLIHFKFRANGFSFNNQANLVFGGGGLTPAEFAANPRQNNFPNDFEEANRDLATILYSLDFESGGRLEWRSWFSYTDVEGEGFTPSRVTQQYVYYPGMEARVVMPFELFGLAGNELAFGLLAQGSSGTISQTNTVTPGFIARDMDRYDLNVAAYAESRFRVTPRWSITPGVRLEYAEVGAEGQAFGGGALTNVRRSFDEVVPLFYMGTEFDVIEAETAFERPLIAYGNVTRSYRPFTYDEVPQLPATASIHGGIDFPSAYQAEIGVRGSPARWFDYNLNGYWLLPDDQVGISSAGQVTNVASTRHRGFEVFTLLDIFGLIDEISEAGPNLTPRVGPRSPETEIGLARYGCLGIYGNFTYQDHIVDSLLQPPTPAWQAVNAPISYSPSWIAKAGIEYNWFERVKFLFGVTAVGHYVGIDANQMFLASTADVPAYTVFDLSAEYTFARDHASAFIQVTNLFDEDYFALRRSRGPAGISPEPERNVSGGIRLSF
jgi:Fe(3+) dicitrate transport protein